MSRRSLEWNRQMEDYNVFTHFVLQPYCTQFVYVKTVLLYLFWYKISQYCSNYNNVYNCDNEQGLKFKMFYFVLLRMK